MVSFEKMYCHLSPPPLPPPPGEKEQSKTVGGGRRGRSVDGAELGHIVIQQSGRRENTHLNRHLQADDVPSHWAGFVDVTHWEWGGAERPLHTRRPWIPGVHASGLAPSGWSTLSYFRELSCQLHNKSPHLSFRCVLYKALLAFRLFSHACRYFCGSVFKQRTNPNVVGITTSEKLFSCVF